MTVSSDQAVVRERLLLMAGRDPLAAQLHDGLASRCGLIDPARILVGFSGGADSTALLLLMTALCQRPESRVLEVRACHVNHGLRPESGEEARHAARICAMLGVELQVSRPVIDREAGNLQECARNARYEVLEATALDFGFEYVCTAHHAEDRFETMLQHICRGGGAAGVAQPRWNRPLGGVGLIRPLLGVARADLRTLCLRGGLAFVDDPSNDDPDSARGFLRRDILPALEARWPGASKRASAAADRIAVAGDALDASVDEHFGSGHAWSRALFRAVDVELSAAALRRSIMGCASAANLVVEQNAFARRVREAAGHAASTLEEPRVYEFAGGRLRLVVTARDVALELAGS